MNTRNFVFTLSMSAIAILASAPLSFAAGEHPCKDKVEAKHSARKALHECLEGWAKDARPGDADPSDDCSAKLSSFVQGAKDVKACRAEHQKKK